MTGRIIKDKVVKTRGGQACAGCAKDIPKGAQTRAVTVTHKTWHENWYFCEECAPKAIQMIEDGSAGEKLRQELRAILDRAPSLSNTRSKPKVKPYEDPQEKIKRDWL